MSRRKRGAAAFIPIDLHEEILYRLPADVLVNFKRVSKEWKRLISSHEFIQKHLGRSISGCNGARIFTGNMRVSETIDLEKNTTKKIPLGEVMSVLGSSDGLALCRLPDGKLAAVNPSTGAYAVRTPKLSMRIDIIHTQDTGVSSWFGHHPSIGEYVLVIADLVGSPNRTITFKVYSLSRNTNNPLLSSSTHRLVNQAVCSYAKVGTFLHWRLHFPVGFILPSVENVILVHSFQTNGNIERMSFPVKSWPTLGVVDGCLSIICQGEEAYEAWMMKEYGVKESWTKFANIKYKIIYDRYISSLCMPLRFFPNGFVVLRGDGSGITKYYFGKREAEILEAGFYGYEGIVCIDSLISPDSLGFGEKEKQEIAID